MDCSATLTRHAAATTAAAAGTDPVSGGPHPAPGSPPARPDGVSPTASGDALARAERHLRLSTRGREQAVLDRWRASCPELADAPVTSPAGIRAWARRLPTSTADRLLAQLVALAQRGDEDALLVVVACLEPGLRSLAARTGISVDEAVSEITLGILTYPVERRTSIAGGLLLDARNRLHRTAQRHRPHHSLDEEATHLVATGELGDATPAAQRIVQLVCQAHREGLLDHTDARLILHTRLGGHRVTPVARRLGLTPSAAYQRRTRAEARLTHVA